MARVLCINKPCVILKLCTFIYVAICCSAANSFVCNIRYVYENACGLPMQIAMSHLIISHA